LDDGWQWLAPEKLIGDRAFRLLDRWMTISTTD